MPLYEFRCQQCKNLFESLLSSSSAEALAEVKCPKCGSADVKKTISASSFRLASSSSGPIKPMGGCVSRGGFS
ncbi:MAG: hypothetical protein BM485_11310 [Desulfobulbaceae bacterium DB1]|nr:MAG: hypothetical protein BM485_11310 [Desulfobulbaceae bacterium DB1]